MIEYSVETFGKISLSSKLMSEIEVAADEAKRVIIRCHVEAKEEELLIRIWKSTFLLDDNSDYVSNLLHAENITLYPIWTKVELGKTHQFILIFDALPKDCGKFHFVEDIPQGGGFVCMDILRNSYDIYDLDMV